MIAYTSVSQSFLLAAVQAVAITRSHGQRHDNSAFEDSVECLHRHSERSHGRCAAMSVRPTCGHDTHIRTVVPSSPFRGQSTSSH